MMEMTAGKLLLSAPPIQFASSIGIGIGQQQQQQSASSPIGAATSSATATTTAATSMTFSSLFNQNDENSLFKMESINSSPLSMSSASAFSMAPSEQEANGRALVKHESEEEMALMAPGPAAAMPSASPPSDPTQMPTTMLIPSATEASTAGGQNIGLQSNSNNGNRPLAVLKPPGDEKEERPSLSYKDLIIEAIESCPERRLKLSEIYQVIKYLHPYYQRRADQWGWQNSIRHNLSLHDCFVKLPLKQTSANGVVGHFWTVIHRNPEDKPGPTRRRSRANILVGGGTVGSVSGKGRKANSTNGSAQRQLPIASRATSMANGGGKAAKGLKGRQSVSSDSGVMSDDGGMSQCQSGNISPSMAGGSASVPAILQIPSAGEPSKFQPLPSPLTLSNHQPLASLHLPLQQPQPSQSFHQTQPTTPLFHHQAAQNLLSPLELVMNGQHSSNSLIQSPHQPLTQPQQFQFSPIPGKTAPAQSGQLLEQQLQQLLAMANFAQQQQPLAAQQQMTAEPVTPASAPPTLLHPLTPTSASLPTDAASAGGLSLLSHLASQALAAAAHQQPQPAQTQLPQPQLAIAAAAAAAELQRLQLLQLYAQQQQQQLQQQLALLEQTQQQQQQQQQTHHQIRHHHFGGHSAPLSPVEEHQTHQQDQQSFLTQLLLARLLTSNSAEQAQQPQQQQQIPQLLHHHALAQKTSPPPPLSAPAGVINSQPPPQLDLHQAALLLEQYQQQQQRQQQQQQQQQQLLLLEQIQREQQQQLEAAVAAAIGAQIGNGTAAGNGTVGSAETAQQQIQTAIQAAVEATTTATTEAQQQQQQQQMLVEPELAVV